ncbi:MAG: glycosyltransferase, partial [Muribaculaceae bacterium]|nr:glycosyltransferase [Muribaculaceae bacterium]
PYIGRQRIDKSFLYIGSIQPGKNIKGMIEGFIQFNKRFPEYNLIIVGKPTYKGEKILSEIPSNENIYYLGYQPDYVVKYLQQSCFATVLLSYCEGFGLPPLEGFKYYKPTLTSNTTSLPEITGLAGKSVNPYDIQDIALGYNDIINNYNQYKGHTQEQVQKYSMKSEMKKLLTILGIQYDCYIDEKKP